MDNLEGLEEDLRRARWGVYGVFFVAGAVLASWVPYIPLVQRRLGLGEGDLGAALLAMTGGALVGVGASRALIERIGSKALTATAGGLFCLLLPAPILAPSFWALAAALFGFGCVFGALDVAMNAQAALVQRAAGRSLMSGFHGLYSVGGMAGSAVAGLLLSREVVKHTGDGIMASFASTAGAVRAALQIQGELADGELGVRVGLNAGEPVVEGQDLFGSAVQLAARITSHAAPGQVLVSNVVRELCAGKVFDFRPLGAVSLRGFPEPIQLHEVRCP